MSKITENTTKLLKFIGEKYESNELDNSTLVQLIELASSYLNLKTLSNYAEKENISYNGAKKRTFDFIKIDNVKFVIDND